MWQKFQLQFCQSYLTGNETEQNMNINFCAMIFARQSKVREKILQFKFRRNNTPHQQHLHFITQNKKGRKNNTQSWYNIEAFVCYFLVVLRISAILWNR